MDSKSKSKTDQRNPSGLCVQCRLPNRYHGRRNSASGLWFEPVPFPWTSDNGSTSARFPNSGIQQLQQFTTSPSSNSNYPEAFDIPAFLPYEVAVTVVGFLLPPSGKGDGVHWLLYSGLVSREWYKRSRDESIWKEACRRLYLTTDTTVTPFLLSPPLPLPYLAKLHPDLQPASLKLIQHYARKPYLHPLGHYAALQPQVRRIIDDADARRMIKARIWAKWIPDSFPPILPVNKDRDDFVNGLAESSPPTSTTTARQQMSPHTLRLLHASHPAHLSPLPPFTTPSFPSSWLLSYATHLRSLSIPFLHKHELGQLHWTFTFRNPVWWRLGELEARSWAQFTETGGYRSGMFEEEVELRWRFLGDDEGEYLDEEDEEAVESAGGQQQQVILQQQQGPGNSIFVGKGRRNKPWGNDHADSHWTLGNDDTGSGFSRFLSRSRAVRALVSLGSLLLTGKPVPESGVGRKWVGRRRRWVQVERYPPLEVSRNKEGGWRLANAYGGLFRGRRFELVVMWADTTRVLGTFFKQSCLIRST